MQLAGQSVRYIARHSWLLDRLDGKAWCGQRRKDCRPRWDVFPKRSDFESWTDAIQKLPFLLGEMTECEIIAARFITSCLELSATSRNWQMFDRATWHYGTRIIPVFAFFFFFFIYLLNAIKINLSCRTVSFHKVGLCDDTWCVIEKNTYNSYTDMRGKIIFSDFCWVSFTGRDTRAAILSYWHADLKTEGLSSLHGKFPVKKSCRCSL